MRDELATGSLDRLCRLQMHGCDVQMRRMRMAASRSAGTLRFPFPISSMNETPSALLSRDHDIRQDDPGCDCEGDNLAVALENARKGYVSIPILPGTKIPAVKWRPWQTEEPSEEHYRHWFSQTRRNLAIITTGLVIFDCDDPAKVDVVLDQCGDTPYKLRTPRGGMHLGYRQRRGVVVGNHVQIKGMPIDIRAENGLALQPFSFTQDGTYEWLGEGLLPRAELPVAKIGWTRQRVRRRMTTLALDSDPSSAPRRARNYIAKILSIQGQRGSDACFRAACKLREFGLSLEEAWPLFLAWNETNAEPPWSEKELAHKLQDAFRVRSFKGGR